MYDELAPLVQAGRKLSMFEISPFLAEYRGNVLVPGYSDTRIHMFDGAVHALPSKTRPKKILIKGSDGVDRAFLLKGLEDLRLDGVIMLILDSANVLMNANKECRKRELAAKTHLIIPCGGVGVIEWIDHTRSLYSIFKQWQRQSNPEAPRPRDIWASKINSALKTRGVGKIERRNWPRDAFMDVFNGLIDETPIDLVSTYLLVTSANPQIWLSKTRTFTRSTAVMCILGYMIGLGDRHLDNILIDSTSGSLVHVDFNVAFDKGLTLGVPECVPFRLTRCLVDAFGYGGLQGAFRRSACAALQTCRKNWRVFNAIFGEFLV